MESPSAVAHMNDVAADPSSSVLAQRVDVALSDGRRILVEGPTSLASVVRLVQGLTE
jgi:transposase